MSGGIVQLVATGAQDTWLTGKPEISFFRSNYKRYTHYALSSERQIIQGNPSAGSISTIRFEKKGDLMSYVYFIGKDTTGALIPGVDWSKVVDRIELLIGGQVVDTQDITWMTQIEPVTGAQNYSQRYLNNDLNGLTNVINGFLPLKFFFCKDWSVALPLVALQYHDVELRITWSQNLGYRVNYEIYTGPTGASASTAANAAQAFGIATATSIANPITGTGASAPAGTGGYMAVTINNASLTTTSVFQPNPFTYTGANFQLVPGMQLYTAAGGALAGSTGNGTVTILSVTPANATSGTFVGEFQNAPTSTSLAATACAAYTTPYNQSNTVLTGGCVGAPAAITAFTAPGSPGVTQAYTSVTTIGYITNGMSISNLPGCSGTGYVTTVALSAAGAVTGFTVGFAASTGTQTNWSAGVYAFNAPAANQTCRLTWGSGTGQAAITYTVLNSGGAASMIVAGQIYVGQLIAAGSITGHSATAAYGAVTAVTVTGAFVTGLTITWTASQTITGNPVADVTLSTPGNATISTATYSSGTGTPTLVYNAATYPTGTYITNGMSISGVPSYAGVGYIFSVSTTPGGQTGGFSVYFPGGSPNTTANFPGAVTALAPIGTVQTTTTSTLIPNVVIYGLSGVIGSTSYVGVNSIITNSDLKGAPTPLSGSTFFQISAINYLSAGVAIATIACLGSVTNGVIGTPTMTAGQQVIQSSTAVTFTPLFPILNVLAGAATGTITSGMTMCGLATSQYFNIPIATVNTVYTSPSAARTLVSINTLALVTAASSAVTPTITNWNAYYAGTSLVLSFVPSSYLTGIITAATSSFQATGTGGNSGTTATGQLTQNGTTTATPPTLGGFVYVTPSMTGVTIASAPVLTNPYVSASAAASITIAYTTSTATTAYVQYAQFVVIPQTAVVAQLTTNGQPGIDRTGSTIISLQNITSSTKTVAVGMTVLGTQYTGPVSVSQIVATNGTFAGSGTATIEISFPVQSAAPSAATSAVGAQSFLQFIDPTVPNPIGFTVSSAGFNGTYQQLQYEAWCSYLYLDGAEREYFASTPMDMLITQINRVPINPLMNHDVNLAHPVKFLAFVSNSYATAYTNSATSGYPAASLYAFKTQLNGVDVGDSRSLFQWQDVPQYYHTPFGYKAAIGTAPIAIISYCLDTSKLQPTGTLNFSRLDSYRIITPSGSNLGLIAGGTSGYIYAMNYNILRIQNGMGSMLYSS